MRKESSTNTLNRKRLDAVCGTAYTISLIGGRWKASILYCLMGGKMRYNELRRSIAGASERILVLQLRELEKDGLIKRIVHAEVPPRVEYELTESGLSMKPILKSLSEWGNKYRPRD
jgi:Predicted transcriptional regulators